MKESYLLLMCFLALQAQALLAQTPGRALFKSNCSPCHMLDKKLVGPPLKNVHEKYEQEWLVSFIQSSQTLIQKNDPQAVAIYNEYNQMIMPNQALSEEEVLHIIDYIKIASEQLAQIATKEAVIARPPPLAKPNYIPFYPQKYPLFWFVVVFGILLSATILYLIIRLSELLRWAKKSGGTTMN